jgi:Domain of unknown function (DUF4386)
MDAPRALPILRTVTANHPAQRADIGLTDLPAMRLDPLANATPRQLARATGALYLVNIVAGAFAIGLVPAMLIVSDPATTAHNIQAHELLYRSGLAAHVLVTLTNVPMALLFYELFKGVNRRLALLDAFFILVATAIEAAGILNQFSALVLLNNSQYTGLPTAQLNALVHLPGDLTGFDYSIYGVFYGCDILCVAYLVLRSGLLPRAIGILLAIDGFAYLIDGFTNMLAPGVATHLSPWFQVPAPLGEGSLALYLLFFGVRAARPS